MERTSHRVAQPFDRARLETADDDDSGFPPTEPASFSPRPSGRPSGEVEHGFFNWSAPPFSISHAVASGTAAENRFSHQGRVRKAPLRNVVRRARAAPRLRPVARHRVAPHRAARACRNPERGLLHGRARRVHGFRLLHRPCVIGLIGGRSLLSLEWRELHRPALASRFRIASTTRTSQNPSSPDGSGSRSSRMQSEK